MLIMNTIYLDNAATTKPSKEVIDAIQPYLQDMYQNPSSLYQSSQKVSKAIEQARKDIAEFIGAKPSEIYFTSGQGIWINVDSEYAGCTINFPAIPLN